MSEKITAIIVDDEVKARNILSCLLADNCPEVSVLAQCKSVPEAVAAINHHQPQIVFLDVDMPVYSGFQLLDFFEDVNFEIIFTTAFSEYALQAFRVSALDFLLKPVDVYQLEAAIEKVKRKQNHFIYNQQLNLARNSIQKKPIEKIAVSSTESIEFISLNDIIFLQADRSYTKIILAEAREIFASKNIKEFEETLQISSDFMRVHRSYIVNLKKVKRLLKTDGGIIETFSGHLVPLGKDQREELLKRIGT